jgi:hypothetical protein
MWFQRSSVVMHGTSFRGVSFTRLSHPDDAVAPAVAGADSPTSTQSDNSHGSDSRDVKRRAM